MTRQGRLPPFDLEAEESLLGAMLLSRSAIEAARDKGVRDRDFYKPAHARIFEAVMAAYDDGRPADLTTVTAALKAQSGGDTPVKREDLSRIQAATPASANAVHYAEIVLDRGALRALIKASGEIAELAYEGTTPAGEVLTRAESAIRDAELPVGGPPSLDIEAWMDTTEEPLPFAIPGSLRRRERLCIVAEPGAGKTTILRQMAVQLSQGIHPWDPAPIDPLNVYKLDCENEPVGAREEMNPLLERVRGVDGYDPSRLRVDYRPEGIDVLARRDVMWLMERIAANRPDVVMLGPLYKLHNVNPNDNQDAKRVLDVLDRIRIRYSVALITETHPPAECWSNRGSKRQPLRITGAGVWTQWPEFVGGLEPEGDGKSAYWVHVRPPRYKRREWPSRLYRDGRRWPWETRAQYEEGTLPYREPDNGEPF